MNGTGRAKGSLAAMESETKRQEPDFFRMRPVWSAGVLPFRLRRAYAVSAELRNKFRFAKHYFIMNVFIYGMKGMTKCKRD